MYYVLPTKVYDPLTLNFFMIFTKLGNGEVKASATLCSSSANNILKPALAWELSSSSTRCFLGTPVFVYSSNGTEVITWKVETLTE